MRSVCVNRHLEGAPPYPVLTVGHRVHDGIPERLEGPVGVGLVPEGTGQFGWVHGSA